MYLTTILHQSLLFIVTMIMNMVISKSHLTIKIVLAPVHCHLHEEEANMGRDDLGQPGDHPSRGEDDDNDDCVDFDDKPSQNNR